MKAGAAPNADLADANRPGSAEILVALT